MRLTTPKNRIVPLVIFAVAGTIISLILGLFYMNRMVTESYNSTIHSFDMLSEDTTKLLREGFRENCETLQTTAYFIGQQGKLDRHNMMEALMILAKDHDYLTLTIVDSTGKGINSTGIDVNYVQEQSFQSAMKGHTDVSVSEENGKPVLVYSAPITYRGANLGVLVATQIASLEYLGEFKRA